MDLSQFPEKFRSRVLSSVVRNMRAGVSIRFGKIEGKILPLTVRQIDDRSASSMADHELEQVARAEFSQLPYQLRIQVS